MSRVDEILNELEYIAHHPAKMVDKWKSETGKKAVGIMPIHCAEEVVHAAGMLPVGMWGGQTSISRANEYVQAFCCSIAKAIMEFSAAGAYKMLDAVICPETCDTFRVIPLMMRLADPITPVIGLTLPDSRKIQAGIEYTGNEYRNIARQLAELTGNVVTNDALQASIDLYDQHHAAMMTFFDLAAEHADIINPYWRHQVVKSSFYILKEKHLALVQELNAELSKLPVNKGNGPRVVVTGIMAEPDEFLKLLGEFGYTFVADDMAQGSRQFRTPTPADPDPFIRLGKRFAAFEGCSCVCDPNKLRGQIITEMVKKQQADGVLVLILKFCDPEEYDYPFIKEDLEKAGIPHLYLEIEQQMESLEQVRTRLQAFAEIVSK
ncbi:MAG: 2-hydroxyacyl-CoA dehydratase subunit D [Methylocystaceae bacterium]